jgi:hypothetical protein
MDVIAHIKERQGELRRATRHVLSRVAKCIDANCDGFAQSVKLWSQKERLLGKHIPNAGNNRRIAVSVKIEKNYHY